MVRVFTLGENGAIEFDIFLSQLSVIPLNVQCWPALIEVVVEIGLLMAFYRIFVFNALILNVFNMAFTLICISLVDKFGRRPLWIWTSVLMIGALAFDGVAFHLAWTGPVIVLVIAFTTIPHHLGLGPLPWLMQSELFPTRLRAKGVCISTTIVWIGGFLSAYLFPVVAKLSEELVGSISLFFGVFIVLCVLSLLFGIKLLPETKNRSLEEIATSWDKERQ